MTQHGIVTSSFQQRLPAGSDEALASSRVKTGARCGGWDVDYGHGFCRMIRASRRPRRCHFQKTTAPMSEGECTGPARASADDYRHSVPPVKTSRLSDVERPGEGGDVDLGDRSRLQVASLKSELRGSSPPGAWVYRERALVQEQFSCEGGCPVAPIRARGSWGMVERRPLEVVRDVMALTFRGSRSRWLGPGSLVVFWISGQPRRGDPIPAERAGG